MLRRAGVAKPSGSEPPNPPDLQIGLDDPTALDGVRLPCGCALTYSTTRYAVDFRFCETHRKVRIVKQDPNWRATVAAAIASVARRLAQFTTDDVWDELAGEQGGAGDPRAIGPAMSAAAEAKLCSPTDEHRKSRRKECHGRPVRVWQSLVAKKAP